MRAAGNVGGGGSGGYGGAWVPQHHRDITLGRLDGFLAAGQFSDRTIRADLWARRCADSVTLEVYDHPKGERGLGLARTALPQSIHGGAQKRAFATCPAGGGGGAQP